MMGARRESFRMGCHSSLSLFPSSLTSHTPCFLHYNNYSQNDRCVCFFASPVQPTLKSYSTSFKNEIAADFSN